MKKLSVALAGIALGAMVLVSGDALAQISDRHLKPGGAFLIKLFQGVGFDEYVRQLRRRYAKVAIRKPAASRKRSPEVYALATGLHRNELTREPVET